MRDSIHMTIPSDPGFMKVLRSTVAQVCEMADLPRREANCVKLAIDEACTNVIRHSYENDYNQRIDITFGIYRDRIEFVLQDYGKKFDFKSIPTERSHEPQPGGLGVYIIREVMDEITCDSNEEKGTRLKLVKYTQTEGK